MAMYDNPFLNQYLPQQPTVPPALIPPQAKKNWQDKLGAFLIQGDANWNPDDATRKQMVKKGLLEAGLSMLANPTGAGNSPLAGISGGLLRGMQQMNTEAADLRGKTIGINGNRMTDYQRAVMAVQDPATPPQVREAALVYLKLNPPAKPETFSTSIAPSGDIVQGSSKGGGNVFAQGSATPVPFGRTSAQQPNTSMATNDFYSANGGPAPDNSQQGQNARLATDIGLLLKAKGVDDATIRSIQDEYMGKTVPDGAVFDERGAPLPSRLVTEGKPLPSLAKIEPPKSAPALTDYDKKRAAIVSKYGEDAAIEWDATGKLPASLTTATGNGKNERQISGENIARDAALERASALTGLPASTLLKMNQQQFEAAVISKGKRIFQGPILGNVPIISDATNADVNSWTDQGGSGVALQMNPTGMITGADVNVGKGIFANSKDPIPVQARKMWKAINPGTTHASNANASVKKISNASEYNALPKGTRFIDPDGNERIKP